jgi:hypothetical protein
MKHKHVIALWSGMFVLTFAGLLVLHPVNDHMLHPMIDSFPVMKSDRAIAYVLSIGHILAWYLAILVVIISLGMAAAIALLALAGICPSSSRLRIVVPGTLAAIAFVFFIWIGFQGDPAGLDVDLVAIVGQETWPGIEYLEVGARRTAAVGTTASILILIAMVGFTYRGSHVTTTLSVELGIVKERIKTLKVLLYLASIGLAAGVVSTAMFLNLHVDFTQPEAAVDVAKGLVRNATLAYGAGFSLLLVLGYTPTVVVLGYWSHRLTQQALPESTPTERRAWRQDNELESPLTSQVWQAIAVLGPILTSVIGEPVTRTVMGLLPG